MNIVTAWDWVEPIVRVGMLSGWAFAGKLCLDLRAGLGVVGEFLGASYTATRHYFVEICGGNLHDCSKLRVFLNQFSEMKMTCYGESNFAKHIVAHLCHVVVLGAWRVARILTGASPDSSFYGRTWVLKHF